MISTYDSSGRGTSNSAYSTLKWGFSDGILPDVKVLSVTVDEGGEVVSSPIEEGSFASYNKLVQPVAITAELAFDGTETYLQSVLATLRELKATPTTLTIYTPTSTFNNYSLESFTYALKREDGLGVLIATVQFIQIIEVALSYTAMKRTASPTATEVESTGTTQPKASSLAGMSGSGYDAKRNNVSNRSGSWKVVEQ